MDERARRREPPLAWPRLRWRPAASLALLIAGSTRPAAAPQSRLSAAPPEPARALDLAGADTAPALSSVEREVPRLQEAAASADDEHSLASWNSGYGPLDLPSQAPGQVLRLGLRPRPPSTLSRGQFELSWTETFANIFAFEKDEYRLDYLTLNSTLSLAYGVSDSWQVDLAVGNLIRADSILDPITDAFHDLFGLGDGGRGNFRTRDNVLLLEGPGGVEIEDRSSGTEATNVTLSLQHNLSHGSKTRPALAYTLSARWDAGGHADLDGSSRMSAGISGSASRNLGRSFVGHLALGYNWHGVDESRGLALADEQWSTLVALEWRNAVNRSWILQYLVSEGAAEDRDPFDDPSHELNLGWKWEFHPGTLLEIGLIENVVEVDNSPDFGLHFGLKHRF